MENNSTDIYLSEDKWIKQFIAKNWNDTAVVCQNTRTASISLILNDAECLHKNFNTEDLYPEDIQKIIYIFQNSIPWISEAVNEQEIVNDKLIEWYLMLRSNNAKALILKTVFRLQLILKWFKDFLKNPKQWFSLEKTKEKFLHETKRNDDAFLYVLVTINEIIANFKKFLKLNNYTEIKELYLVIRELDLFLNKFISSKALKIRNESYNLKEISKLEVPKIFRKTKKEEELNKESEIIIHKEDWINLIIDFNNKNHVWYNYIRFSNNKWNKSDLFLLENSVLSLNYQLNNFDYISFNYNEFLGVLTFLLKQNQEITNNYISNGSLWNSTNFIKNKIQEKSIIKNNKEVIKFLEKLLIKIENFINFLEEKLKLEQENQEKIIFILKFMKEIKYKFSLLIDTKNNLIKAYESPIDEK